MCQRADDRRRQKRQQNSKHEAARRRVGEHSGRNPPQSQEIDREQRENRAELDEDCEGIPERLALRLESEQPSGEQQMTGGRNGDELGEALKDAENDRGDEIEGHRWTPRGEQGERRAKATADGSLSRNINPAATPRLEDCTDCSPTPSIAGVQGDGIMVIADPKIDSSPGRMPTLFHHTLCPHSRFVRLVLGEYGLPV